MQALSPMMQQYMNIKEQYTDCILFFRLGDFYEMFFEDALLASRELEITLTGRDCAQEERAPMCGVPFHSAEGYIAKLVSKGYKVAICEQIDDPQASMGIVKRDVVRIITPGTLTEQNLLDEKKNNYLCCVCASDSGIGLAFCDISTGELFATQLGARDIALAINQIAGYAPREIVFNNRAQELLYGIVCEKINTYVGGLPEAEFEFALSIKRIADQFNKGEAIDNGYTDKKEAACAVGAILSYLLKTQKTELSNMLKLVNYETREYMDIDYNER